MATARFSSTWLDAHRVKLPPVDRAGVVGIGHVLREIDGVLARLGDPELVRELGIELPRGLLLHGRPGTGKTLSARILAGRLGPDVAMYEVAADELTPDRIRGAIRALAQRHERSVLYIDEIDQFALHRADTEAHTPETRAVLVATLAALDGLVEAAGPILVASTNRHPSSLDPALMRAGRIGLHIAVDEPDESERHELFAVMVGSRPVGEPLDFLKLARLTRGHTPADIKDMVNDGYGLAVSAGRRVLLFEDLLNAVRRAGSVEPDDAAVDPAIVHRAAIHESGHVACGYELGGPGFVRAVLLTPTGGRTTMGEEGLSQGFLTADEVRDLIRAGFGGMAAERLILEGGASVASEDDVEHATALARRLASAGQLEGLAPVSLGELGFAAPETLKAEQGEAIARLLEEAQETATSIVASRLDGIAAFAGILERTGELVGPELEAALAACFGSGAEAAA